MRGPGTERERQREAGVVVPNGTLFAGGVAARIKEELLTQFNLHILSGLFAHVSSIAPYARSSTRALPVRASNVADSRDGILCGPRHIIVFSPNPSIHCR